MTHKFFRYFISLFLALVLSFARLGLALAADGDLDPTFGINGKVTTDFGNGDAAGLAAPPANDNFANPEAIPSLPFSTTVDLNEATLEPDEPQTCLPADRTVWYTFVPTATMVLIADAREGSGPKIGIFRSTGSGFTNLESVQCVSPGGAITFLVEQGQTYYIQVGAVVGEWGIVQFSLSEVTAISGRVTDAITSAPLPGDAPPFAFVSLQRVCGDGCLELVSSSPTDSEGRFRFDSYLGIQDGTYQIEVSANLYQTEQFGPFEFSGANLDVGDLPIDPPLSIGSIRGRLIDTATGMPVLSTFTPFVQLYRCIDGNCFELVNALEPDSQGRFRFETDSSGNPLPVGTYQILVFADQYQQTQTDPFEVSEGVDRTVGNLRITSFPVRFSDIQRCADIPASGGQCASSVKIWNGLATKLRVDAWSMVDSTLPDSFGGFTVFQVKEPESLDLDKGRSKVFRIQFSVPANNSHFESFACTRVFVGQGSTSFLKTVGVSQLFCVLRNAGGFTIVSPQEGIALAQEEASVAIIGTEVEPNSSCQTAQDAGTVPFPFTMDGNLDSSQAPDIDFYRFSGTAGAPLIVDHEGEATGKGTLGDPLLGFFDSNCNLIAVDDSRFTANSQLVITIPADGVFILAATASPDYAFIGGGDGSYQLTIAPYPAIGSISGTVTDAVTGQPLRGDVAPFALVHLQQCSEFACIEVNDQPAGSDGRFRFDSDYNGAPLPAGDYKVIVYADQYEVSQSNVFTVGEGEDYETGNISVVPLPVQFSDIQPCVLLARGGVCEFSVRVTNGFSTQLSSKAWSIVQGFEIGSFANFTIFQTDTPRALRLNPGTSTVLRFRFRVPGRVADGATICTEVFVGQGEDTLFNTVGTRQLFCLLKGTGGFTLLSENDAKAALRELQNSNFVPPDPKQDNEK